MPIFIGDVQAGNHKELLDIIAQFKPLVAWCVGVGINLRGVIVNIDKCFDSKPLRIFYFRHGLIPDVKENVRNRKKLKRG